MKTGRIMLQVIGLLLAIFLLSGCGGAFAEPTVAPTSAPPAAAESAFISGRVHLVAPPTPRMVIYAVDPNTGLWAFTETQATDGEASFTMVIQPGVYQVFAFSDIDGYAGYTLDGKTLAFVTVAANQTASDIVVGRRVSLNAAPCLGSPPRPMDALRQ